MIKNILFLSVYLSIFIAVLVLPLGVGATHKQQKNTVNFGKVLGVTSKLDFQEIKKMKNEYKKEIIDSRKIYLESLKKARVDAINNMNMEVNSGVNKIEANKKSRLYMKEVMGQAKKEYKENKIKTINKEVSF
ncbi:MAG: hypothetical protein AAB657_02945 [Patescibacteria group bacterium]